jgi:hypothetical protein
MFSACVAVMSAFVSLGTLATACAAPVEGGDLPKIEQGGSKTEATTLAPTTIATVSGPALTVSSTTIGSVRIVDPCAAHTYPTNYVLRLSTVVTDADGTKEDLSAKYGTGDGYTIFFPTPYAYVKDQVAYESLINSIPNHNKYEYLIKNVIVEPNADGTYALKNYANDGVVYDQEYFIVGFTSWSSYQTLHDDIYSTPTPYGYSSWSTEKGVDARLVTCAIVLDGPDSLGATLKRAPFNESYIFAEEHDPTHNPN